VLARTGKLENDNELKQNANKACGACASDCPCLSGI